MTNKSAVVENKHQTTNIIEPPTSVSQNINRETLQDRSDGLRW